MKSLIKLPKSRFIKVMCKKCKNEQVIFNKAASRIKCLNCQAELALPSGGKIRLTTNTKVLQELS